MPELKITLESLYRSERELEELGREAAALPEAIAALNAKAEAARQAVESERQKLEEAEQRRRQFEAELADTEAKREKYEGQTALVKTNAEYTALLAEIETAKQRASALEEEILLAMEAVDEVSGRLDAFTKEKKQEEAAFVAEAEKLGARLVEVEAGREARESERQTLSGELPAEARSDYDLARRARGSGVAVVQQHVCSGCHRDVPYETVNRLQAGELLSCMSCQRVLVVLES